MRPQGRARYTILLRSGWQTVNIGDIAHTPGMLAILERHLPEASVILWANRLDRGVEPMLRRRFPNLRIVRHIQNGDARKDAFDSIESDASAHDRAIPENPSLAEAIEEADLLLHGSSASVGSLGKLHEIYVKTGIPYGAFGVTVGSPIGTDSVSFIPPALVEPLQEAEFIYTRETKSLEAIKQLNLKGRIAFVPDATFALDLKNEDAAFNLLRSYDLEPDRFICVVPRLRFSPYWEIYPERVFDPEEVARKKAINEACAESDHAKLRKAIIAWVRETGMKVLICPEMTYQVKIMRPLLFDPLPEDVKRFVVLLERYWLTDEAASVYRQARVVVSMECHSPIIANANGRPAFYLRQPTDTWKGQMFPDLGLGEWKFEIESCTGDEIAESLLRVHEAYDDALEMVRQASSVAASLFKSGVEGIRSILSRSKGEDGRRGTRTL